MDKDDIHVTLIYFLCMRYIFRLEYELGMSLPYWDSRMDFYMEDPTDSILWTPQFFGNGYGDVETGPFANWQTPVGNGMWVPLTRNMGSGGSLITNDGVTAVLSRNSHSEILEPVPNPLYSLEAHHNGPHTWVDGHLSALETAAQDPVFYFHHAFIDYIWSLFRRKLWNQGQNPQFDYPQSNVPRQRRFDRLLPFNMRNINAWSNYFDNMVRYRPPPSCPNCGPYAECAEGMCRSRVALAPNPVASSALGAAGFAGMGGGAPAVRAGSVGRERGRMAVAQRGPLPIGRRFISPFTDTRTRGDQLPSVPSPASRMRRSVPSKTNTTGTSQNNPQVLDNSRLDHSYQNTYVVDGVADINRWAFVPVRIIYERPPETKFESYVVKNGELVKESDIFTKMINGFKVHIKAAAIYPKCKVAGSGASKIFVQADGITYAGKYKDYAIVDERLVVSSSMAYIGVKNPSTGAAKAYFSAYDICGRVCKARCLINGSYQPCSGAVQITSEFPKMYGVTREDAVKRVWKLNAQLASEPQELQVPVVFSCENQTSWPWESS